MDRAEVLARLQRLVDDLSAMPESDRQSPASAYVLEAARAILVETARFARDDSVLGTIVLPVGSRELHYSELTVLLGQAVAALTPDGGPSSG